MISTEWLLLNGHAIEFNPILRFYVELGLIWFVVAKSLFSLAPIVGLEALRQKRPKFVTGLLRFGIIMYLVAYGMGVWQANAVAQDGAADNYVVAEAPYSDSRQP